jgi:hypothetical protein
VPGGFAFHCGRPSAEISCGKGPKRLILTGTVKLDDDSNDGEKVLFFVRKVNDLLIEQLMKKAPEAKGLRCFYVIC